jgi:hypothetical protein
LSSSARPCPLRADQAGAEGPPTHAPRAGRSRRIRQEYSTVGICALRQLNKYSMRLMRKDSELGCSYGCPVAGES